MNTTLDKNAGKALLIFVLLLLFTMVMHPVGGSIQHLQAVSNMIIATHLVAILSLPFGAVGFWGLTKRLGTDDFWAATAMATTAFALSAVMMAGTANGLVLPLLLQHTPADQLFTYNHAFNAAFDYVYTALFSMAMLFWSIAIIRTRRLPQWYGYAGIVLSLAGPAFILCGFAPSTLTGVRLFFAAIGLWITLVGLALMPRGR